MIAAIAGCVAKKEWVIAGVMFLLSVSAKKTGCLDMFF
nr:hypothetical protein [uncultured bacterium]